MDAVDGCGVKWEGAVGEMDVLNMWMSVNVAG